MLRHQILQRKAGFGNAGIAMFCRLSQDVIDLVGDDARHRPLQKRAAHGHIQRLQNRTQCPHQKSAVHAEIRQDTFVMNDGIPQDSRHLWARGIYRQRVYIAPARKRAHNNPFKFLRRVDSARTLPRNGNGSRLQQTLQFALKRGCGSSVHAWRNSGGHRKRARLRIRTYSQAEH